MHNAAMVANEPLLPLFSRAGTAGFPSAATPLRSAASAPGLLCHAATASSGTAAFLRVTLGAPALLARRTRPSLLFHARTATALLRRTGARQRLEPGALLFSRLRAVAVLGLARCDALPLLHNRPVHRV